MSLVIELVRYTLWIFLSVVQLAMLVRAVMSWFMLEPNRLTDFLYAVTEPFMMPLRRLFEKMNWFQELPIDVSSMATFMILSVVLLLLS
ncbi:MAG: YggT family protein [Clostridia bacterium]|nr:YggT family protein [Clostridia bacterium]